MLNLLSFPVLAKAASFRMSKGVLRIETVSISVDSDGTARDIFEDLTPFFDACFMVLLSSFRVLSASLILFQGFSVPISTVVDFAIVRLLLTNEVFVVGL